MINPAPSNLEELVDFLREQQAATNLAHNEKALQQAESQLKQLILKDVLDLIGADDLKTDADPYRKYVREIRNTLKSDLRQSARKRYQ